MAIGGLPDRVRRTLGGSQAASLKSDTAPKRLEPVTQIENRIRTPQRVGCLSTGVGLSGWADLNRPESLCGTRGAPNMGLAPSACPFGEPQPDTGCRSGWLRSVGSSAGCRSLRVWAAVSIPLRWKVLV